MSGTRARSSRLAQVLTVELRMAFESVLVVDDDLSVLALTRHALCAAGYTVDESLNGRRALKRVLENPPKVLITEILMAEDDGVELIAAVKRAHPDMCIIAVAKHRFIGALDLLDLASMLGASAGLDKPLNATTLLDTIARVFCPEERSH